MTLNKAMAETLERQLKQITKEFGLAKTQSYKLGILFDDLKGYGNLKQTEKLDVLARFIIAYTK